ncbi:MAG: AAA family ATPase [Myxococcaceae bacterium]
MARKRPADQEEGTSRFIERDLTALAAANGLPATHGYDALVSDIQALVAGHGKHPLLAGEPGVGKTAIVQELARRVQRLEVPEELRGARIVEVSMSGVLARGERWAADNLDAILDDLGSVPKTIVYIRDAAVALGSAAMPVLVRAVRQGALRFIMECDLRRAQDMLRADETLGERLHLVIIPEPPDERVRWMLGRVAEELESEYALPIEPEACDQALRLARKFLVAQRMPRKAIELLREAAAEASAAGRDRLGAADVLARFTGATRLPRFLVDDAVTLDLDETSRFFNDRILGQPEAVSAVLRAIALLKAGLNDPRRPLGVFLFAGPTGVGKTHLAKLLAEFLFGATDRLVRLNMADYPDEGDETIVFGAPWAESMSGRRGELTRLLDGKVFSVLLLDEFEKAHSSLHDRFLQLFDEGAFVNAAGESVICNNTLIIATSNVGAEVFREAPMGFAGTRSQEELRTEVDRRIGEAFRPEFLNRFDVLCHFQPLTRVEIRKIARREVGRVLEREGIRSRGLDVEVAPSVIDLLVERGYSPLHGARFLQREIEKTLSSALAEEIVRRPLAPGTPLRVEVRSGGHVVAKAEPKATPAEAVAKLTLRPTGAGEVKKKLDRRSLLQESEELARRARGVARSAGRPAMEARKSELLTRTQAPDFWDDPETAARVLRDFRTVEAQLRELDRVVGACEFARKLVRDAKGEQHLVGAARAVEEVAREVQILEAQAASGQPVRVDDALVELEAAAETEDASAWVKELAWMYLGWAQRRGYEAVAIAEGSSPARVVLRVGGPGVLGFLGGEAGLHRRVDDEKRTGAYVRVRRWPDGAPEALQLTSREVRRRPGSFVERIASEASAHDDATGKAIAIAGAVGPSELEHVAAALLDGPPQQSEVRRYFVGRGARVEDPRTGVSTPRVKDVLRGELETFIAGWMSQKVEAGR